LHPVRLRITFVVQSFAMSDQPPSAPTPPPAAPAKSGNRVVIIIVCLVVGFLLLVGGCVSTCVYLAAKKAKEFSREAHQNPVYASLSLAASLNPDVQVLSKDPAAGKITVRNKKTGETLTLNAGDYTSETVSQALEKMSQGVRSAARAAPAKATARPAPAATAPAATSQAGPTAALVAKFPDYLPGYPRSTTVEASLNALGATRVIEYEFTSGDNLDDILAFYEKKATAAGFTVMGHESAAGDHGPTADLSLMRPSPQATLSVHGEGQGGGGVRVTINLAEAGR